MPLRNTPSGKNFHYTKTSPENILSAKMGAMFVRIGFSFYINRDGNLSSQWEQLDMKSVIIPFPDVNSMLTYDYECDLWFKSTNGFYNEYAELLPKTGWQFISHKNPFIKVDETYKFSWTFPTPSGSFDFTTGDSDRLRSVDNNFFYSKINYVWYRTPITTFDFNFSNISDTVYYTNLPFIDSPTSSLPLNSSSIVGRALQQTIDEEAYYIKTNNGWRRCLLTKFTDLHKMSLF